MGVIRSGTTSGHDWLFEAFEHPDRGLTLQVRRPDWPGGSSSSGLPVPEPCMFFTVASVLKYAGVRLNLLCGVAVESIASIEMAIDDVGTVTVPTLEGDLDVSLRFYVCPIEIETGVVEVVAFDTEGNRVGDKERQEFMPLRRMS